MKTIQLITTVALVMLLGSCGRQSESAESNNAQESIPAGHQNLTFEVWGNCEMCEETIETSLKVNGVSKADWSTETNMITVSFDPTLISEDEIYKKIAGVGYDTEKYKGDDKAYAGLPECCQYSRKQ